MKDLLSFAMERDMKVRAVNEVKLNLSAPSKFILTDAYGNRISHNQLKVEKNEKMMDKNGIYPFCYSVTVVGEAMNRFGGYEQIYEKVYFYNGNTYMSRPYVRMYYSY